MIDDVVWDGKIIKNQKFRDTLNRYSEIRRKNARKYYWTKKGKSDDYIIQQDLYLLNKKLKSMYKVLDRLGLKIEIKEKDD